MATCTKAGFSADGKCWTGQSWSAKEQAAIIVWRLAIISDSFAGVGLYATALTTLLLTDSNTATCGMSDDQIQAALIGVLMSEAAELQHLDLVAAIATATRAEAAEAIKCLENVPMRTLKTMQLFLICRIMATLQAST